MSLLADRYGNLLSTDTATAALYRDGVDAMLGAGDALIERADRVLMSDPEFALGHVLRARALATYGRGADALAAATTARSLVAGVGAGRVMRPVSERERSHVHALGLLVEGRTSDALAAIRAHLETFPRDAMVLQPATGIFGLIGFSGELDREAKFLALMNQYAAHYVGDWWFSSIHAFAECEAGHFDSATDRVSQSMALNPRNGNAAHVLAHLHYERQADAAGAAFLSEWLSGYPKTSLLRTHLTWHHALIELALGRSQAAWQLFHDEFAPSHDHAPPLNQLTDIVSWLWRAELTEGQAHPEAWRATAARIAIVLPKFGVAFGDAHRALLYAKTGDHAALEALRAAIAAAADARPAMRVAGAVGEAMLACAEKRWTAVIELLEPVLSEIVRVGGSRAQRDLVDATLMTALHRVGDQVKLAALRARRPQVRPLPQFA